jgi:hypothetical protein
MKNITLIFIVLCVPLTAAWQADYKNVRARDSLKCDSLRDAVIKTDAAGKFQKCTTLVDRDSLHMRTIVLTGSPSVSALGDSILLQVNGAIVRISKALFLKYLLPGGQSNNYVLTTNGADSTFTWTDKSGGSVGTITSLNGSSEAAQTLTAMPWLKVKESGTGNSVHTIDTAWGRIIPTGTNNLVDSAALANHAKVADSTFHAWFSWISDSARIAFRSYISDSTIKIKNTTVVSGAYGSAKYTPQYVVGNDGRLTSSTQVTTIPDSSWKADSAMKITNIIAGGAIGSSIAIPIINYNAQGRITSASSALPDTAKDAGKLGGHLTSYFEPAISAGTTTQYWRGDKTWQVLSPVDSALKAGTTNRILGYLVPTLSSGWLYGDYSGGLIWSTPTCIQVGALGLHATADSAIASDRARKLTVARTIGNTSFDGTANIVPDSSNSVKQATKLTTARTIGLVSFDGTANIIPDTCDGAKYWGGHLWPPTYTDVGAAPAAHGVTTGYLPYANSSTTLNESPVYTDGTGIAIGTTSISSALLHLYGNGSGVSLRLTETSDSRPAIINMQSSTLAIWSCGNAAAIGHIIFMTGSGSGIVQAGLYDSVFAIGTNGGVDKLVVKGNINDSGNIYCTQRMCARSDTADTAKFKYLQVNGPITMNGKIKISYTNIALFGVGDKDTINMLTATSAHFNVTLTDNSQELDLKNGADGDFVEIHNTSGAYDLIITYYGGGGTLISTYSVKTFIYENGAWLVHHYDIN